MNEVAIIGAGELGGSLAFSLARRDTVRHIRLIDEAGTIAAGKALDITQASPIERFATRVTASTDVAAAAGASIVVIADGAAGGEWLGDDALMVVRRLFGPEHAGSHAATPGSPVLPRVVLCAGAGQREAIERGVRELRVPPTRLFGSAPEALVAAVRALVAIETNLSPADVALTVVGIPPSHIVIPWEDGAIAGAAAARVITDVARRRVTERVRRLWPPGPLALAAAAMKAIEAMCGRSRALVSCFVTPEEGRGVTMRAAALPVRLGAAGVARIELPALTVHDQVLLDNAMRL
jgi:malate dehydrogenase